MKRNRYRPKVTNSSWVYGTVRFWLFPLLWLFFRRRKYHGKENLVRNKPLFLIPNHQNAFMDAISFIPVRFTWQFAFLMRAKSFEKKTAARLLYSLNMLPIYRQMDGADLQDSNSEVFENCAWLMERKRPIICWAEGTHSLIRRIRPIKKGPLRFAFAAEERNNWNLDVHFVPVGMNYTDRENFGGDYLANIGKPIRLADYKALYEENPARALNEVKKEIERALEQLAVHIPSEEYYTETEWLREMAINDFVAENAGHTNQVKAFEVGTRAIAQSEKLFKDTTVAETTAEKLRLYRSLIDGQQLRDNIFAPAYRFVSPALQILFFVLLFPLFLPGFILHYPFAALSVKIAKKLVKDPAFNSSILWVMGVALFSLEYALMFLLTGFISGSWLYALLSWPAAILLGAIALGYKRRWNKFAAENHFRKFVQTPGGKTAVELRQQIMNDLYAA